ncbi:MAG: insulinase family protein, partial [Ruminococcaceae bacterium]|nr:insulinase family protein [Oscillospiraceae bacterium]
RRLYHMLLESLYEKHNVRINVAGTVESISHITADILYECYRVFYNLSNMKLIVCGDVTVDEVNEVCDKVLKEQAPVEIIRDYPEEKAEVFVPRAEYAMQVGKPLFAIGVKNTAIPADGYGRMKLAATAEILNEVLFGKAGEFYNKLYEEGLLSGQFSAGYDIVESFSFNSLFGESRDPDAVFARFKECVEDAKKNGLSEEDFERSKRALYAAMVKVFDSTDDIANYFLSYALDDGDLLDYVDILSKVTFEDVTELLHAAYKPEYYTLAIVKPIETEEQ